MRCFDLGFSRITGCVLEIGKWKSVVKGRNRDPSDAVGSGGGGEKWPRLIL